MAFPTLQANYKIPNSFMFQFIQLKSIVHTKVTLKLPTTPLQGTHTLTIITRCMSAPTKPKSLSLCYKTLLGHTPPHAFNYVKQWGKEDMPELTDNQWLQSLNALKGLTSCFSHVEAHKKVIYRWYLTPQRLHQIYPTMDSKCWRCGSREGTMTHIWWECSGIKPLWSQVQQLLGKTLGYTVDLTPMVVILLLFPPTWKKGAKKLASTIILAARNLIALHWRSTYCPTHRELLNKIYQFYRYEVLSSDSHAKTRLTEQLWEPWLSLIHHHPL
ncbi:Hypothetical predicted protein [Pelobates cultripes]|uniref:Uncharacterized protein n=1 Tax=Pelobates cultripes TaxID=61616 RepID=A0AAD1TKY3_PELCU|nr:Hypothetical predicted protein [Pelobates cultripes]